MKITCQVCKNCEEVKDLASAIDEGYTFDYTEFDHMECDHVNLNDLADVAHCPDCEVPGVPCDGIYCQDYPHFYYTNTESVLPHGNNCYYCTAECDCGKFYDAGEVSGENHINRKKEKFKCECGLVVS